MVISLTRDLESVLREQAQQQGISPEELALSVLQSRLLPRPLNEPRDDWERRLRSIARDCGVSLTDEAVSSEGIYE
jgi:hypothetical protein